MKVWCGAINALGTTLIISEQAPSSCSEVKGKACCCAYDKLTVTLFTQGTTAMFGYTKIELENANVSMLMPQPFSQRHPSYLQRYTSTGDPHIIDKVQEVVALHK
eukprot:scaffold139490_cov17-Tisochrysis_lutea.AAC.1